MKSFWKTTFAATLGIVIAWILVGLLSTLIAVALIGGLASTKSLPVGPNTVLCLELDGAVVEYQSVINPLEGLSGASKEAVIDLQAVREALQIAGDDPNIIGVYLKLGLTNGGFATLEELRQALRQFQESGKFVYAYCERYSNQGGYYVASLADTIVFNPMALLEMNGLSSTVMFYTDLFKKVGVEPQVFRVGTYKSAVEPFFATKMSPASRQQTESFMGDIWERVSKDICADRGLTRKAFTDIVDAMPMLQDTRFLVENRLADALLYLPEMEAVLAEKEGCKVNDLRLCYVDEYLQQTPVPTKYEPNKIAVYYASGQIYDESRTNGLSGEEIVYDVVVDDLRALQADSHVKAVVLRVNSPGGSVYASEQICEAVKQLKKEKPVVVSMSDYAASGGYYISSNADAILASPNTLTGSIGIFGLSFNAEKLARKAGLHYDVVQTNRHGDFGNLLRSMTSEEKALMQRNVEHGYELFVGRCAEGRGMEKEAICQVAEGRVWTGRQAYELGLVDSLGYLNDAIRLAAELAGVENYRVANYPEKADFFTLLLEEMGISVSAWLQPLSESDRLKAELRELRRHSGTLALMPYCLETR